MTSKSNFMYPYNRYRGEFKPENLAFDANLQEFAQKISYICNLETSGKISPERAYEDIKNLWQQLSESKEELGIGNNPFQPE